jgi:uncharacterized coiled-coil protein SlyX
MCGRSVIGFAKENKMPSLEDYKEIRIATLEQLMNRLEKYQAQERITIQLQHDRITKLEQRVKELGSTPDPSPISANGEITLPEPEIPLLHVIDDKSLWIDELRQHIRSLKERKEETKKQYESEAKENRRHPDHANALYHEMNALREIDSLLQKMLGDNPILVRRQT